MSKEAKANKKVPNLKFKEKHCPFCQDSFTYFCQKCTTAYVNNNSSQTQNYCSLIDNNEFFTPQHVHLQYINVLCLRGDSSTCHGMWLSFVSFVQQEYTIDQTQIVFEKEFEIQVKREAITFHQRPGVPGTATSASSLKSKKSSNILAAIVKRARIRKKFKSNDDTPIKNILDSSHLNGRESTSTFGGGIPTEDENELELNIENYEKCFGSTENLERIEERIHSENSGCDGNMNRTLSNNSVTSGKIKKPGFFQRLMKKQASPNELKKTPSLPLVKNNISVSTKSSDKFSDFNGQSSCTLQEKHCKNSAENIPSARKKCMEIVATSYINFGKPMLSIPLVNGLQIVEEIVCNLKESEAHLLQVLSKYITDSKVQTELVDTLYQHSKIQWEAERRTSALANEMWMQQLEIGRAQEKNLQKNLSCLVKQNRELQSDNEVLFKKYEKLLKRLRGCPVGEAELHSDGIFRHNEKLLFKLETYRQKTESMETEMKSLQKQNDMLEQELRNSSAKMHNLKSSMQRLKTDYELEQVSLNFKLNQQEQTIKDALEAADVVFDDLESLKRQFENMPFSLSGAKCKYTKGTCLSGVIHMCRTCINELSKELMAAHAQLTLKEQDSIGLRDTNTKLQENLKKSTEELDSLSRKIQKNAFTTTEKMMFEQKCKLLETELKNFDLKMDKMKTDFESEKSEYAKQIAEMEKYKTEAEEKNKMIEETKLFVNNITNENFSLRAQVEGLNRLLHECGAGDVAKELEVNQEQISYFRAQFCELAKENQRMLAKLDATIKENETLRDKQEVTYKHLRAQIKELEKSQHENAALKHRLDCEHQTLLSLQNERVKLLEEKSVLKNIFQHMKAELHRVQKLESSLTDVTKQASQLGMIAEYNKQQGEKLKSEVIERDHVIHQLKANVQKLNELQIKNAKEKLSLCYELSEVCQIKDQLNNVLSHEKEKIVKLGQSKQELAKIADSQIQKFEEKQKSERNALKILSKDLRAQLEKFDSLKQENDKLSLEVENLKRTLQETAKKHEHALEETEKKKSTIDELKKELLDVKFNNMQLTEQFKNESDKYEMKLRPLQKLIQELRKDKSEMEKTIEYLQNNSQKLHKDLNLSRESEKNSKDIIKQTAIEKGLLEEKVNDKMEEIRILKCEKEDQAKEIRHLNALCEKILNDFEVNIKTSENKEQLFKNEINETKSALVKYSKGIEELNQLLRLKEERINKLTRECENYEAVEMKYEKLHKEYREQEKEIEKLLETKNQIQAKLDELQDESNSSNVSVENLKKELYILQNQINIIMSQKEDDYNCFQKQMEELVRRNRENEEVLMQENNQLKFQITALIHKLQNEKAAYETLSQIHKEVSQKFMRSVKELVDAKNTKKDAVDKLKVSDASFEKLLKEKKELQAELESMKLKKESVEQAYINLQQNYNNTLLKTFSAATNTLKQEAESDANNEDIAKLQETIQHLSASLEENFNTIQQMKEDISNLTRQKTEYEFQKSEITMRLHETERKLETEKNITEQLKNTRKLVFASLLRLKDDSKIESEDCAHLLHMVGSNNSVTIIKEDPLVAFRDGGLRVDVGSQGSSLEEVEIAQHNL